MFILLKREREREKTPTFFNELICLYRANKPQGGCQNTISKQVSFQEQINKT